MTKDLLYQLVKNKTYKKNLNFSLKNIEDVIVLDYKNTNYKIYTSLRWQFDSLLTPQGIDYIHYEFEKQIENLINNSLIKFYSPMTIGFVFNTFFSEYSIRSEQINDETHLKKYLDDFIKCLEFHEKEVFPKLLDISFLAEYVGSVTFENQMEIPVGGKYPVSIFKKLAILKWGIKEEKYNEYKKGLQEYIKEDFDDPKYRHEAPIYKEGFEKLINHLENEPNPFKNKELA